MTGDVGERGPAINLILLKWCHNIWTKKIFQHREKNWAVFGGARPSHTFEGFQKASYHLNEKLFQHREMSWIVFEKTRPGVQLNVFESLHNITTKKLFNAAKRAEPWQKMLGNAAQS